jgi:CRP-like cAMP-binding protein
MVPLEFLKSVHFLQDLEDYHLQRIAAVSELKEIPAGSVVFQQGEDMPFTYLVLQGEVSLEMTMPNRGTTRIHTVGAGDLLGWSPLVGAGAMTATARTVSACRLISIDTGQLLPFLGRYPEFGLEFMRRAALAIGKRLNDTRLRLLDIDQQKLPPVPGKGSFA